MNCLFVVGCWVSSVVIVICNRESYETYLDGTGYTYGTANQCPEMGYWILKRDTKLWILVSHLDTEKKYKFQTLGGGGGGSAKGGSLMVGF